MAGPKGAKPESAAAAPVQPVQEEIAASEPEEPAAAEPAAAEPAAAEPAAAEPAAAEPDAAEPDAAEPDAAEPEEPAAAEQGEEAATAPTPKPGKKSKLGAILDKIDGSGVLKSAVGNALGRDLGSEESEESETKEEGSKKGQKKGEGSEEESKDEVDDLLKTLKELDKLGTLTEFVVKKIEDWIQKRASEKAEKEAQKGNNASVEAAPAAAENDAAAGNNVIDGDNNEQLEQNEEIAEVENEEVAEVAESEEAQALAQRGGRGMTEPPEPNPAVSAEVLAEGPNELEPADNQQSVGRGRDFEDDNENAAGPGGPP